MSGRTGQGDTDGGKTITVRIVLRGRTEDQALPTARAYLFDRAGRLAGSKPIAADPVTFNLKGFQVVWANAEHERKGP